MIVNMQCDEGESLYDYAVRPDGMGWQHWKEQVPQWIYPKEDENPKYSQLIIPTLDSVRYEKLFSLLHSVNKVGGRRPSVLRKCPKHEHNGRQLPHS